MADLFSYLDELKKEESQKKKTTSLKRKKDTEVKAGKFTVFELTSAIKKQLEGQFLKIWVEGEISNYKRHSSGHHYFSIKDEKAVIACVMWRGNALKNKVQLKDGVKVELQGSVTVYPARGNYQLDVTNVKLAGVGDLQLRFEELKEKLRSEGLFREDIKQQLPYFCKKIGVVTAETGAAFQDIRKVIKNRAPFVEVIIYNAKVQGDGAERTIAKGIEAFNKFMPDVDLLIVGRGGGSLEDLWPFNEELTARAIAASKIPVISAVGHEIDFSIADFTADKRAATPSHGAEIATINVKEQLDLVQQFKYRIKESSLKYFKWQNNILERFEFSYAFQKPAEIIKNYYMILDNYEEKLNLGKKVFLEREQQKLTRYEQLLAALGPDSILQRGYSLVKNNDGKIIKSVTSLKDQQALTLVFKDGEAGGEFTRDH
jgi:exodeoxyribonuclease VII large subunit